MFCSIWISRLRYVLSLLSNFRPGAYVNQIAVSCIRFLFGPASHATGDTIDAALSTIFNLFSYAKYLAKVKNHKNKKHTARSLTCLAVLTELPKASLFSYKSRPIRDRSPDNISIKKSEILTDKRCNRQERIEFNKRKHEKTL